MFLMINIRHFKRKHGSETTWINKKLTLNSMSMAAGEEETERLVKNGKLGMSHQPNRHELDQAHVAGRK